MPSSHFFHLDNDNLWHEIHDLFQEKGGVYQLYCQDEQGHAIPINRAVGTDPNGILYIGKADSFLDRVITLRKAMDKDKYKSDGYICARRYHLPSRSALKEKFPFKQMYLTLSGSDAPEQAEKDAIEAYVRQFGESPPLNSIG